MGNNLMRLEKNKIGNDYIVGDIHGSYTLLMKELDNLNFDFKKDRLFSVGDLIDRGSKNEECLELIYQKWFFPVIGNHELLFMDAVLFGNTANWFGNGGAWFLKSDWDLSDFKLYAQELGNLFPFAIELYDDKKVIGIVHAEPLSDWNAVTALCEKEFSIVDDFITENLDVLTRDDIVNLYRLTWGRGKIYSYNEDFIKNVDKVYVGHSIVPEVICLGNVEYIDIGAYKRKKIIIKKIEF